MNNEIITTNPKLIEPGVKYFLDETLKNCNKTKKIYLNKMINIGLFLLFILIIGSILYYNYRNKNDKLRIMKNEIKNQRTRNEIIELIRKLNDDKYKEEGTIITNLPYFESDFESAMKKFQV